MYSPKKMNRKSGFTLVEIMIVVAIIGILVAIAVPSWLQAREKSQNSACLEAQQKINGAIDNWAIDEGKITGDDVAMSDIVGYKKYLKATPMCPVGPSALVPTKVGSLVPCPNTLHPE